VGGYLDPRRAKTQVKNPSGGPAPRGQHGRHSAGLAELVRASGVDAAGGDGFHVLGAQSRSAYAPVFTLNFFQDD
jgi:hypothetical protein